jgi:hypothetical protein
VSSGDGDPPNSCSDAIGQESAIREGVCPGGEPPSCRGLPRQVGAGRARGYAAAEVLAARRVKVPATFSSLNRVGEPMALRNGV